MHVRQGAVWERWRNGGTWMKSACMTGGQCGRDGGMGEHDV